jgi:sugar (pentulose or hexulose) kinase
LRESPVWTQIIADVLAQTMFLPDTREASSRGAVLLALEKLGKLEDLSSLETPPGRKFTFDQNKNYIYQKARARHQKFYDLLFQ